MRVFQALTDKHPLVTSSNLCPLCQRPFVTGQRTVLAPCREATKPETIQAIPLHATCSLAGMQTPKGLIERIKDGDASPFPVLTNEGQYTLEEVGLTD